MADIDKDGWIRRVLGLSAAVPPPPPGGPKPKVETGPRPDPAALTMEFAALVRRIPGAKALHPASGDRLAKLATDANVQIKTNNLLAAARFIDELRTELDSLNVPDTAAPGIAASDAKPPEAGGPGAQPKGDEAGVRLAKGLLVWNQTRSYVGQQIAKLQAAILTGMKDEPDFEDIKANIGNLEELLETLDDSLSDQLSLLRGAADPAKKAVLSDEARAIVARFQKYVAEDDLMNDIDDNGFIPLDIKPKVTAALAAVLKTI